MAGQKSRARSAFRGVIAGAPNKGTVQIAGDKLDGRFFRDEAALGRRNKEKVGIRAEPGRTWVGQFVRIDWTKPAPALHDDGTNVPVLMAAGYFGRTLRRGKKRAAVLTGGDYVDLYGKNMFRAFAYAQNLYLLTYRGWKGEPREEDIPYLAAGLNIFNILLNHAKANRIQPDTANWRAALGQKFKARIEKNPAKAKGFYEKALELIPGDPQARLGLGRIYARMGQFSAALREVNAALARWPDYAEAYVTLGAIRMSQNRRREGIAAYKKAIESKPAMWRPYFNLARVLGIVEGSKYESWAKEAAPWRAKWMDRQISNLILRNIERRKK